jgi:predicted Zn-dependent protease
MRSSFIVAVLLYSSAFNILGTGQAGHANSSGSLRDVVIQGVTQSACKVPIPDLTVTLRNVSNGDTFITTSDSSGEFELTAPAGKYVMSATLGTDTALQTLHVTAAQRLVYLTMPARERSHRSHQPAVSVFQLNIPEEARKALQEGIEASNKNRTKDAIDYTTKAIDLYPRYAEAFAVRALLERELNEDQFQADSRRAIEYDPNSAMGNVVLASAYIARGKFDDAVRTLNGVIATQPDYWMAHYEMTRALLGKRDYPSALVELQGTYNLVPKPYPFLRLAKVDVFIGLNDPSSAIKELETFLQEAPSSSESENATLLLERLRAVTSRLTQPRMGSLQPRSAD